MKLLTLLATATAASAAGLSPPLTPRQNTILWPHRTYRRWVQTGELKTDPQDQHLIVKNGNQAEETTAIVSFQFDESTKGKKCQLLFRLWPRDVSTGSRLLDVFTYKNLPDDEVGTLKMRVLERHEHVGRIKAEIVEEAEWVLQYDGWPVIECPAGETIGVEYVGVGDDVVVRWDIGVTGPRFQVLE